MPLINYSMQFVGYLTTENENKGSVAPRRGVGSPGWGGVGGVEGRWGFPYLKMKKILFSNSYG